MTPKEKLIIAVAVVASVALLAIDGLAGSADCESQTYDQTIGECVDVRN